VTIAQELERLLAEHSRDWRTYASLGSVFEKANDKDNAKRAFAAAASCMEAIPADEQPMAEVFGLFLYKSQQYPKARDAFTENIKRRNETEPTISNGPRWWLLAISLKHAGEPDKAREIYDALVAEMAAHPAPDLPANEPLRAELADLLGIIEPTPNSPQQHAK
jgi:tetratricopeptide (TPR) repeat protein